ncbi:MAG TPA: hypothetical protein VJ875_10720 [Pyrinomonadaceae bacterium]|nr:hypothetical protein [Pyrinomonadaceae bacterium]
MSTSTWESTKTFFKSVARPFIPVLKFFSRTLSVWLLLLGLTLIVIGATKPWQWRDDYYKVVDSIGSAVLVGGVFDVLLKSLQYSEVFKRELSKIIYGKEDIENSSDLVTAFGNELRSIIYGAEEKIARGDVISALIEAVRGVVYENQVLQQRKDLTDLWETISIAVYKTKYPEISEEIARKVTKEYFPSDDTFYYDLFQENISLTLKPDKKYIETKEVTTLRIKPLEGPKLLEWKFGWVLYKDPTDTTKTQFFLDKVEIDAKEKTKDYQVTLVATPDGKELRATLEIPLAGKTQYDLRLELRKTYKLELNRQRDMKSSRFINRPEFRVSYNPNDLELEFVPVGTRDKAYENQAKDLSAPLIWNVYKDLIFPNQGYRLVLHRR